MKNLRERTAILTGANGGLGAYMANALAAQGMNLLLVAFPGVGLEELQAAAMERGVQARVLNADLREPAERVRVVEYARQEFGHVDVLVNNAGVVFSAAYHELTEDQILEVLKVYLEAPLILTRLVLPGMLERRQGHIVNISSLSVKSGPGYQEPYAATNAD